MKKYRFKTKEQFQDDDRWVNNSWAGPLNGHPSGWAYDLEVFAYSKDGGKQQLKQ